MIKLFGNPNEENLISWTETVALNLSITPLSEGSLYGINLPSLVEILNGTVTHTFASGTQDILNLTNEVISDVRSRI
jgi:hypothetical protein